MSSLRSFPLHAKCGNGSVINIRVVADKKDNFFVTGFFNGSSNPDFRPFGGLNFLESDCLEFVRPQIVHVVRESGEGVVCNLGKMSVTIFDCPYSAGRKDMLPVEDRIINQVLLSIGSIRDEKTLDKHDESSGAFYFSEGFETAKRVAGLKPARRLVPLVVMWQEVP